MLSRTADGLFWLARYMERAENVARILTGGTAHGEPHPHRRQREQRVGLDAGRRGLRRRLSGEARRDHAGRRRRLPGARPRQPVERALVPRDRAPQRARRAHGAHRRHVGGAQRHLARAALARESRAAMGERIAAAARVGEAPLAALPRRLRQHHAAQRRLLLHAARHLPRARRQHRAHPRREVPRAAAARARASAARSTTATGSRSCARSRRCAPTTGSTTSGWRRG